MADIRDKVENPIRGYVLIAVTLVAGMLAASALGQTPKPFAKLNHEGEQLTHADSNWLFPSRNWVLGVRADATDTGYLIRQVERSGAALQFGLEVGDRIVAINGQQIGKIGGRVVRLGDQLEQEGGLNGEVLLLIQNHRNDRLVPLRVTLRHPTQHLGH